MRLILHKTVALNLWNDGGVHAEIKVTTLSNNKVYGGSCLTADQVRTANASSVEIYLPDGKEERVLIELYHVHVTEGTSYVGRTVLNIEKNYMVKAAADKIFSKRFTLDLEKPKGSKNPHIEQMIRTQLILVPTIPVYISMITCHDLETTFMDRNRDIYVVGRVVMDGERAVTAHNASFITNTAWNYREGKALNFRGDKTGFTFQLTAQELKEADLVIFVKDRGMFDDEDSYEDDGEILGMAIVSLNSKINQVASYEKGARISLRLNDENGDQIETTCDFNLSCSLGSSSSSKEEKKKKRPQQHDMETLGKIGKAEFMRSFLNTNKNVL